MKRIKPSTLIFIFLIILNPIWTKRTDPQFRGHGDDVEDDDHESISQSSDACPSNGEHGSPISVGREGVDTESQRRNGQGLDPIVTHFNINKFYGKIRDRFYVQNNGQAYYFQFESEEPTSEMTVRSTGWDDEYVLAQGRLHWGTNESFGSEHVVHGIRYPLELQLIHYRKSNKSLADARTIKDGVLILSIVFELDEERLNPALNPLVKAAKSVFFPGPIKQVHGPLLLKSLLPLQMRYFEYSGSSTSPPCGEGVKWVVFEEAMTVASSQLDTLRKLAHSNGASMSGNFRNIQPLHGRTVKYSGNTAFKIHLHTVLNEAAEFKNEKMHLNFIALASMALQLFKFIK